MSTLAVRGLKPRPVWKYFEKLAEIPRPSGHEGQVLAYLKRFAESRGLQHFSDEAGNLAIHRPGQHGGESQPGVMIQGHVDMVTEKNAARADFDFLTDPIELVVAPGKHVPVRFGEEERGAGAAAEVVEGEDLWVRANGTTLGADNGIGVAMALAVLDDEDTPTPPLQCVFTVDEETGLTGAFNLDADALHLTAQTLLNLDTEEWGIVYNGCAGGGNTDITLRLDAAEEENCDFVRCALRVGGLRGGHSGVNIHEYRANAIKICADVGSTLFQAAPPGTLRLVGVEGGMMHNAIPRECTAVLDVAVNQLADSRALLEQYMLAYITPAYSVGDVDITVELKELSEDKTLSAGMLSASSITETSAQKVWDLLSLIPSGPLKFSHWALDAEGQPLVETSNNLASVEYVPAARDQSPALEIVTSARSFFGPAVDDTGRNIVRIAKLVGAQAVLRDAYPAWAPTAHSPAVNLAAKAVELYTGRKAKVAAIHAGLECGVIMERMNGNQLDAVSFGPVIEEAHTPNERVHVPSVEACYSVLQQLLADMAKKSQN